MGQVPAKVIKTYMSFGLPLDPANIKTLVDLDLSYALGATLVDWNESREISPGLADSWEFPSEKEVLFHLRADAKWSDGGPVTAEQVVKSLERAKRTHPELKILFDVLETVEAKDAESVLFKLKIPVAQSGIIKKLTEPMYGLVFVKSDGVLDLAKTAGSFYLRSANGNEITLAVNKRWWGYAPSMADEVVIRQPRASDLPDGAVFDDWSNLAGSSSISEAAIDRKYGAHCTVWHRKLDRTFFLAASPRHADPNGRALLQGLSQKLNRETLTRGLTGLHLTPQFFPSGYVLFDPEFQESRGSAEIPAEFKEKPIKILVVEGRLSETLKMNIADAIREVTGLSPQFVTVPLNAFEATRAAGDYDLLAANLPVNDPNIEGALSFFFALTPAIIPNAGEGAMNFKARIERAQRIEDEASRHREYRKVFSDATHAGSVFPLFHFSTIAVARDGIDLSGVPETDETVSFAKVRFK
jgi:MarR-like DNA-binding transcriptional regulator SgrR of sgrS sRNA